ncbi:hypothetical protein [Gloeothece verrucosa]|uniref:Uncharacterized protein n=1 Tax=Gloeothece verrucosa (strain PCC 7822) TaxID=497965 RepID=E0UK11_GLOV7|nr:hypothetical protein [Gloeothece verrucosa]ADN14647.1 hypothetical protein Cyan7822_2680 [Gloeothece verrucosa PCC 7822]
MKNIINWTKKIKFLQRLFIVGLEIILVLATVNLPLANAESLNPEKAAQKSEQAADTIVQNEQKENVKQRFQVGEEGSQLIDKAREHAQDKLKSLADETREKKKSGESLPPDKYLFMKKMQR